ncbi:MAG: 2-methylaconitate cis-trans isomerase PrpF [Lautropia sp.]
MSADAGEIPAVYMRGGTSKGVFFHAHDLPASRRERDALLLRIIGSPDPYGRHSDGMGGATSSTSKVVIVSPSTREGCDVDYLFGAVSIDQPLIDWSGNCGNLAAAVGPFAIGEGVMDIAAIAVDDPAARLSNGYSRVRIWQQNLGRRIDAWVPMRDGLVIEEGNYAEDGVAFAGAEIRLEYLNPADRPLPTGAVRDVLQLADGTSVEATLIDAGNPTVFIPARAVGLTARETPEQVDRKPQLLQRLEEIRALAAVRMNLAASVEEASARRPATPKVAWVAPPVASVSSSGKAVAADAIDVLARILSMGKLHHAFTGTGSIALAVAAAIPGTVVSEAARTLPGVPTRIGHLSGTMAVGAEVAFRNNQWRAEKCMMSRSARRLMRGVVYVAGRHV